MSENAKKECCIEGCQFANFAVVAVKVSGINKQVYLCLNHFGQMQENAKQFFETHFPKADWREHVHWEKLDYWDMKFDQAEQFWIEFKEAEVN